MSMKFNIMKHIRYNGNDVLFDDSDLPLKKYSIIIDRDIVDNVYYSGYEKLKDTTSNQIVPLHVIFDMIVIKGKTFNTTCYEVYHSTFYGYYLPSVISYTIGERLYYKDIHPILLTTDDKKEFLKWKLIL